MISRIKRVSKFVLFIVLQPSETSADTSGEASRQTEIPMLTVAVMQANRLSASSASSAAVQAVTTNRMV